MAVVSTRIVKMPECHAMCLSFKKKIEAKFIDQHFETRPTEDVCVVELEIIIFYSMKLINFHFSPEREAIYQQKRFQ